MYQILIVDEEEHLLWALERNLFPQRTDVQVHTAASGEEGLEILKKESIDLLISDIKMPGEVDGFQLILRAKEMVPDARVMIITAFGTQRIQNFAERIGISHYIEKPFTVEELREAILEILDEKEGFQGVLSDLELTDIIQMLCLAKRTALLHLKHRDHRGRIVFDAGEVTHAEFDGIQGPEAVYEMLDLRQGDIFMQSDFEPTDRTIDMGWQDLLLEGVRRTDERRLEQAQQKSRELSQASMVEESEASEASEAFEEAEDRGEKRRTMTPMGLATMGDFELGESSAAS
jgi:DNA-binding response OmpR family regulator